MKQIIYLDHNNPEKTLNLLSIYTIKLEAGISGTDKHDTQQIAYLRSIGQCGYKTHAIIHASSAVQAFGQIYALMDHCDRIHIYMNPKHFMTHWEIFTLVYKTWILKTRTKIYFSTEIMHIIRTLTLPLDIQFDPEK